MPRQWKVIQHVREKFSCRACEAITQPPAPSHPIARGRAGPQLLAHVLFAKYGLHLPLNRQSDDLCPRRHRARRLDAGRLGRRLRRDADAAGRCDPRATSSRPSASTPTTPPCRCWPRARPAPAGCGPMCATTARSPGADPPAACFFYSPDRGGEHPEQHLAGYAGLMQADAYAGFNRLYEAERASRGRSSRRRAGRMRGASSSTWRGSARRRSRLEAVERIDALFAIEREINGLAPRSACACARSEPAAGHRAARPGCASSAPSSPQERDRQGDRLQPQPLDGAHPLPRRRPALHVQQRRRAGAARHRRRAKELDLRRLRRGGRRAAAIYTLIETAKLNDVDPAGLARRRAGPPCRIIPPSASTSCCLGTGRPPATSPRPEPACRQAPPGARLRHGEVRPPDVRPEEHAGDLRRHRAPDGRVLPRAPERRVPRPGTGHGRRLCRKRPSPFASGQPRTWACGIIYVLGQLNFLSDKSSRPT